MKKLSVIFAILLVSCYSLAQQPSRDGQRMPPPNKNGGPRMEKNNSGMIFNSLSKDIPNLTLEQKEKVSSLLTKENDKLDKEFSKKKELEKGSSQLSEKDVKKRKDKLTKIDGNIDKIKKDTNKKVKKVLDEEQYQIFETKREQLHFDKPRGARSRHDDRFMDNEF